MRRGPFRKVRGVPDKVLQVALTNHQDVLQQLVAFASQTQGAFIRVNRLAVAGIALGGLALMVALLGLLL